MVSHFLTSPPLSHLHYQVWHPDVCEEKVRVPRFVGRTLRSTNYLHLESPKASMTHPVGGFNPFEIFETTIQPIVGPLVKKKGKTSPKSKTTNFCCIQRVRFPLPTTRTGSQCSIVTIQSHLNFYGFESPKSLNENKNMYSPMGLVRKATSDADQ